MVALLEIYSHVCCTCNCLRCVRPACCCSSSTCRNFVDIIFFPKYNENIIIKMPICSVLDCDEVYLTRDNVRSVYSFFSFPRDDHLCAEWIRRIGRDPQTFSPTFARVCSKHFEDSQLTLTATGNRPAKRKDCVPTLHLPLTNSRGVPINLAAENDDQLQMIINIIRNKPPQSRVYKKRPSSTSLAFSKPYNGINSIVLIQDRGLNIKEEIDEDAGINPFNESIEDLPSIIKSEPTQCRLCLAETNPCVSIFDEFHSVSNSSTTTMTVIDAISKLISLQVCVSIAPLKHISLIATIISDSK